MRLRSFVTTLLPLALLATTTSALALDHSKGNVVPQTTPVIVESAKPTESLTMTRGRPLSYYVEYEERERRDIKTNGEASQGGVRMDLDFEYAPTPKPQTSANAVVTNAPTNAPGSAVASGAPDSAPPPTRTTPSITTPTVQCRSLGSCDHLPDATKFESFAQQFCNAHQGHREGGSLTQLALGATPTSTIYVDDKVGLQYNFEVNFIYGCDKESSPHIFGKDECLHNIQRSFTECVDKNSGYGGSWRVGCLDYSFRLTCPGEFQSCHFADMGAWWLNTYLGDHRSEGMVQGMIENYCRRQMAIKKYTPDRNKMNARHPWDFFEEKWRGWDSAILARDPLWSFKTEWVANCTARDNQLRIKDVADPLDECFEEWGGIYARCRPPISGQTLPHLNGGGVRINGCLRQELTLLSTTDRGGWRITNPTPLYVPELLGNYVNEQQMEVFLKNWRVQWDEVQGDPEREVRPPVWWVEDGTESKPSWAGDGWHGLMWEKASADDPDPKQKDMPWGCRGSFCRVPEGQ